MASKRSKTVSDTNPLLEWVVAAVGLLVVAVALSILIRQAMTPATPADPVVRVVGIERAAAGWRVDVEARNHGRTTATEVDVSGILTPTGGTPETASATLDYVAGGGTSELSLLFRNDPRRGQLVLAIGGWSEP